jgi:hypothetical protein
MPGEYSEEYLIDRIEIIKDVLAELEPEPDSSPEEIKHWKRELKTFETILKVKQQQYLEALSARAPWNNKNKVQ